MDGKHLAALEELFAATSSGPIARSAGTCESPCSSEHADSRPQPQESVQ